MFDVSDRAFAESRTRTNPTAAAETTSRIICPTHRRVVFWLILSPPFISASQARDEPMITGLRVMRDKAPSNADFQSAVSHDLRSALRKLPCPGFRSPRSAVQLNRFGLGRKSALSWLQQELRCTPPL